MVMVMVMEGQGRSRMVFSHHWIYISVEKSYWWMVGWVACRIIVSAPVPVPFIWTLDLGLDLGLTIFMYFSKGA